VNDDATMGLRTDGGQAWVTMPDGAVAEVPIEQVVLSEGVLWLRLPGQLQALMERSAVTVQALHPEPSLHHVAQVVSSLPVDAVAAQFSRESQIGSADDPLALIALRAICAVLMGEQEPPSEPETME
jgi:hypothetical protein